MEADESKYRHIFENKFIKFPAESVSHSGKIAEKK